MKKFALIKFALTTCFMSAAVPARAELILNEALANEIGSATTLEWIEVLNWLDTGSSISLDGYRYIDGGDTTTIDTSLSIPAGGFIILARKLTGAASFEETWGDRSGIWGDHAVEAYPAITMPGMSLRNATDTIRLGSPSGNVSTLLWKSDAGDGISIERIRPGANDDVTNFGFCRDSHGSTPARHNSVLPPARDLAIDSVVFGPTNPVAGEKMHFAVHIENVGFGQVNASEVTLARDLIPSPDLQDWKAIGTSVVSTLAEGNDTTVVIDWDDVIPGVHHLRIQLFSDGDSLNNQIELTVTIRFELSSIVVSEYLANPEPDGPDEWIEIVNLASTPNSLERFEVGDSLNVEKIPIQTSEMPTAAFWVLCENQTAFRQHYPAFDGILIQIAGWRALNNTGDKIRLIGPAGEIIDSLTYATTYDDNRSVERVELAPSLARPRDWTVSVDSRGATPGSPNSVVRGHPGFLVIDSVWVQADSLHADRWLIVYTSVTNSGFGPAFAGSLFIGRTSDPTAPGTVDDTIGVATVPVTMEGQTRLVPLEWRNPPPGIHRLVSWFNGDDGSIVNQPGVTLASVPYQSPLLIITEFMAAPEANGPDEWIELFNASDLVLSTRGLLIGNSAGAHALFPDQPVIDPGSFIVIAKDPAQLSTYYNDTSIPIIETSTWPSLNGNGDLIRLLGPTGEIIDSISTGDRDEGNHSIERRLLEPTFADPRDWGVSVDPSGATPGRANSIERLLRDLSLDSFQVIDQNLIRGGSISGQAWVTNRGFDDILNASISAAYDPSNHFSPGIVIVYSGSTVTHGIDWANLPPGMGTLSIRLSGDETPNDNSFDWLLVVPFEGHELVISEFLSDPSANGPGEWIEVLSYYPEWFSLRGLKVGDAVSRSDSLDERIVCPQLETYYILAEDTAAFRSFYRDFVGNLIQIDDWPALNNQGDLIRILGPKDELIDSASFSVAYGNDRSVERLDVSPKFTTEDDWVMSIDPSGATPGRPNSVSAANAGSLRVDVSPNPAFRSAGQVTRIDYRLDIGERLTLKVFDRDGRAVRTIADDTPSASGFLEWDGTDDDGVLLRPGPYILMAKSEPAGSMSKTVVVIAP